MVAFLVALGRSRSLSCPFDNAVHLVAQAHGVRVSAAALGVVGHGRIAPLHHLPHHPRVALRFGGVQGGEDGVVGHRSERSPVGSVGGQRLLLLGG